MAITLNKASAIGDIMTMKAGIPLLGVSALNSFTDVIVGELAERYFLKEFRYTLDGMNWEDWETLTDGNLQAVSVDPKHIFKVEYKYERAGTDDTGELELVSIEIDGDFAELTTPDIYWSSVFGGFFELYNLDSLEWARNVLEKIYVEGILPKYIERNLNNNEGWEDKDFIDFWFSITHFFSLFVEHARSFQDFYIDEKLLFQYLTSKGLYLSKDMNYDELYSLMGSYFEEIRSRGTLQVVKPKSSEKYVNGELLRLINKFTHDEFVFSLVERNRSMWNVNNCSPLYRGVGGIRSTIKGYETTDDVVDLDLYPLLNSSGISIVDYSGVDSMKIMAPVGVATGIGSVDWDPTKAIVIDPSINYEISFWALQPSLANDGMCFKLKCYDKYGNFVPVYSLNDFSIQDGFFNEDLGLNIGDKWYFVRGILYNKNEAERSDNYKLNIGIGTNLRVDKRAYHMIPQLYVDDSVNDDRVLWVKNFMVRPVETTFQRGFIGIPNLILTWMKNRSGSLSTTQIEDIMRNYLLPYGNITLNNWI